MQTDCIIRSITWTVPSASDARIAYTVSAPSLSGILTCNCKAREFPKTRGRCWHIKSVRAGQAGKPRVRVQQRPVRVMEAA
jgi:hypothetical protein